MRVIVAAVLLSVGVIATVVLLLVVVERKASLVVALIATINSLTALSCSSLSDHRWYYDSSLSATNACTSPTD